VSNPTVSFLGVNPNWTKCRAYTELMRLAGKKFGHPAGKKKIKLQKVKRNKPNIMEN